MTSLVTGAARRLGRETALALAREGSNVVVHYNDSADDAKRTAEEIRACGVLAWTLPCDLTDSASIGSYFRRVVGAVGPVDILINNASIFPRDQLGEVTAESISTNIELNAVAPLILTRDLAAQGRDGVVVNLLDSRILDYDKEHVSYHLSKRALFTLTRLTALEFAPRIRVNAVAPGLVLPPNGEDENYLTDLQSTNPMGRHGSSSDVSDAIVYLVEARFVTGQVLFVDGGRHLRGSVYG